MNPQGAARWLLQPAGVALVLLAMVDVFMTVLYARAGTGPLSHRLASWTWAVVRRTSRLLPRRGKDHLLAYFAPAYLVLLMASWIGCLLLGFTLIAWPNLGSGIQSTSVQTPGDLLTAFYYAGGSLTTVGTGDLRPVATPLKVLTVLDSVLGISMLTLTLSYIIQIYSALSSRNTLALSLHDASRGTGDASVLLAALAPRDDFTHAESHLVSIAMQVTSVYESHHFYSVLTYFRFRQLHYAMARGTLLTMELVTLISTALDEDRHGWLDRSAAVNQIRQGAMHVLTEFAAIYLPGGPPDMDDQDRDVTESWRARYRAAVDRLRRSGVSVTRDVEAGAERYVELRHEWDPYVMAFARYMEHTYAEIDPAGAAPDHLAHGDPPELEREADHPLRAAG